MKTVHKKVINLRDIDGFRLPANATVVAFAEDGTKNLCVWYEYYTENIDLLGDELYRIFGTGHKIDDEFVFVSSTVVCTGFVWHLYKKDFK